MTRGRFATPKTISNFYPGIFTEGSIRAFISKSATNDFERCLRRVGRRVFINLDDFEEWLNDHLAVKKENNEVVNEKIPHCPQEEIIALYHEILPMCPQVKIWNKTRQLHLKTRWRESGKHQSLDFWRRYFTYVSQSKFLTGQISGSNGRVFFADLEWLIRPTNFAKVIERRYHNENQER